MASSGLLALLGGAAKYGLNQQERRDNLADDEKKARLAMKLQQELEQAKLEYAKKNPEFNRFMDTPEGTVGFDSYGGSKLIREASPGQIEQRKLEESRATSKAMEESQLNTARSKQAEAAAAASPINAEANRIRAAAETTRANRPPAPKRSTGRMPMTEDQYKAAVITTMKATDPGLFVSGNIPRPDHAKYPAFKAKLEEEIAKRKANRSAGYEDDTSAASESSLDSSDPFGDITSED